MYDDPSPAEIARRKRLQDAFWANLAKDIRDDEWFDRPRRLTPEERLFDFRLNNVNERALVAAGLYHSRVG